jgi:hypothetical protein
MERLAETYAGCEVRQTNSLAQAEDIADDKFLARLSCVILDAENPDGHDYPSLAKTLRARGYTGPIIAASRNPEARRLMLQNGCSHDLLEKERVCEMVVIILDA